MTKEGPSKGLFKISSKNQKAQQRPRRWATFLLTTSKIEIRENYGSCKSICLEMLNRRPSLKQKLNKRRPKLWMGPKKIRISLMKWISVITIQIGIKQAHSSTSLSLNPTRQLGSLMIQFTGINQATTTQLTNSPSSRQTTVISNLLRNCCKTPGN